MTKIIDCLISILHIKVYEPLSKVTGRYMADGKIIIKHGGVITRHPHLQPINAPEVISFALPVGIS